jgi:hypothetical protein
VGAYFRSTSVEPSRLVTRCTSSLASLSQAWASLTPSTSHRRPRCGLRLVGSAWVRRRAKAASARTVRRLPLVLVTAVALSPLGFVRASITPASWLAATTPAAHPSWGIARDAARAHCRHATPPRTRPGPHLGPSRRSASTRDSTDLALAVIGSLVAVREVERSFVLLPAVAVLAAPRRSTSTSTAKAGAGTASTKRHVIARILGHGSRRWGVLALAARGGGPVLRFALAILLVAYCGLLVRGQTVLVQEPTESTRLLRTRSTGSGHRQRTSRQHGAAGWALQVQPTSNRSFTDRRCCTYLGETLPTRSVTTAHYGLITALGCRSSRTRRLPLRRVGISGLQSNRRTVQDSANMFLQERARPMSPCSRVPCARSAYRRTAAIPWVRGPFGSGAGVEDGAILMLRLTGGVVPTTNFAVARTRPNRSPADVLVKRSSV